MNNLRQHIFFIEEIIQNMGIDFAPRRIKKDSIEWEFHRSESRILMFLRDGLSKSEDKREILVITSPVMAVPDENIERKAAFLEKVLVLNHYLVEENLSISKRWLFVSNSNYINLLSEEDITNLLDNVSYYSHKLALQLKTNAKPETAHQQRSRLDESSTL